MGLGVKGWEKEDNAQVKKENRKGSHSTISSGSNTVISEFEQQSDDFDELTHLSGMNHSMYGKNDDDDTKSTATASTSNAGGFSWFGLVKQNNNNNNTTAKSSASVVSVHSISSSFSRGDTTIDNKNAKIAEEIMEAQREEIKMLKFKLSQREACITSLEAALDSHRGIIQDLQKEVDTVQEELSESKNTILFYQQRQKWRDEEEKSVRSARSRLSRESSNGEISSGNNSTIADEDDADDIDAVVSTSRTPRTAAAKERLMRHEAKSEHRRLQSARIHDDIPSPENPLIDDEITKQTSSDKKKALAEHEEKSRIAALSKVGSRSCHTRTRSRSKSSHRRHSEHRRTREQIKKVLNQDGSGSYKTFKAPLTGHNRRGKSHGSADPRIQLLREKRKGVSEDPRKIEMLRERTRSTSDKSPIRRTSDSEHLRSRSRAKLKELQRRRTHSEGRKESKLSSHIRTTSQEHREFTARLKETYSSHSRRRRSDTDDDVESVGSATIDTKSVGGSEGRYISNSESQDENERKNKPKGGHSPMRRRVSKSLEDSTSTFDTFDTGETENSNYSMLIKKSDSSRVCLGLREKKRLAKKKAKEASRKELASAEDEDRRDTEEEQQPRRLSVGGASAVSNITMDSTIPQENNNDEKKPYGDERKITFRPRESIIT